MVRESKFNSNALIIREWPGNRSETMSQIRKLTEIEIGQAAVIVKVNGAGAARRRMIDMGMTKGSRVEVIRKAPMGDPVEFRVKGYHLTLRKAEADLILVEEEEK